MLPAHVEDCLQATEDLPQGWGSASAANRQMDRWVGAIGSSRGPSTLSQLLSPERNGRLDIPVTCCLLS